MKAITKITFCSPMDNDLLTISTDGVKYESANEHTLHWMYQTQDRFVFELFLKHIFERIPMSFAPASSACVQIAWTDADGMTETVAIPFYSEGLHACLHYASLAVPHFETIPLVLRRGLQHSVCPVCERSLFEETGIYEVCTICQWEDDPIESIHPDYTGGANSGWSQNAWRENFLSGNVEPH